MYRRSDTSWGEIGILILILIVVFIISRACSSARYNNGICKVCGGRYVYHQSVGHAYTTDYIYRCDKCGHTIEVDNVFPEEKEANQNETD